MSVLLVQLFLYVFINVINLRLEFLPPLFRRQVTEILWIRTLKAGQRETEKRRISILSECTADAILTDAK